MIKKTARVKSRASRDRKKEKTYKFLVEEEEEATHVLVLDEVVPGR